MKKQLFFLAAAALALASCSSENDVVQTPAVQQTTADDSAVDFDAYLNRGVTRSVGKTGVIDLNKLKEGDEGFGVFGYYTNSEKYSGITKPNFFYNQNVYHNGSVWEYTPIKYWPNEFGTDAISDQVDRVTFFAYAPWVDVDPLTGLVKKGANDTDDFATTNIISMTRNNVTGDPNIRYSASMDPQNCTDLLYGVAAENFTSSNSSVNYNNIAKGKPYIDVVKPGTDANSKIKFDFKHALAQLKVTIDANVEDKTTGSTNIQTDHTRIWVRSITFEGITRDGALNLNSTAPDPQWYDINGVNKITTGSITVYDGRKDSREPLEKATTEEPATFNPTLIQSEKYTISGTGSAAKITTGSLTGVTSTETNLFNGPTIFAIPTGEKMKVTIVYDVETYDPNLAFYLSDGETLGSTIENKITKTVESFGSIKAGYCYYLKLHLGMRTVDFDAMVTPWQDQGGDIDLPSNLQTFAAKPVSDHATGTVKIPWNIGSYEFAVSGLTVNATPSIDNTTPTDVWVNNATTDIAVTSVNSAGVSKFSLSNIKENNTINDKTDTWTITDGGTNQIDLSVTQFAAPLSMSVDVANCADNMVRLRKTNGSDWKDIVLGVEASNIKVWRNGQLMVNGEGSVAPTAANTANINRTSATDNLDIYFKSNFEPGDVITIWIKGGNAPEETVTLNVGGMSFVPATHTVTYQSADQDAYLPRVIGPSDAQFTGWSSTHQDVAKVKSSSGIITTKKASSTGTTISTSLKTSYLNSAKANGWYFPIDKTTGSYTLYVNRQPTDITFTNYPKPTNQAVDANGEVVNIPDANPATAVGTIDDGDPADGDFSYEIVSVAIGSGAPVPGKGPFEINSSNVISVGSSPLTASTTYTLVVKATLTDGEKFAGGQKEATFTITTAP